MPMGLSTGTNGSGLTAENRQYFCDSIIGWGKANLREFPWRWEGDCYKVLVSEILLVQTFARKVVPVYEKLISEYPSFYDLALANAEDIREIITPLGLLYRADLLIGVARVVVEKYDGKLPNSKAELQGIKGIGDYIASAVQCFVYDEPVPIFDANVSRILGRFLGMAWPIKTAAQKKAAFSVAGELIPKDNSRIYNYSLLDFGALVCKYYNPLCSCCPIARNCCLIS